MRKLALIVLTLCALLAAGCGDDAGDAASPLDNALRYLPADAPFAVAIATDTEGEQADSAGDLADRFPGGSKQAQSMLRDLLGDRADKLDQIEAALGNPFVVGSTDARSFIASPSGEDTRFVGAIQASSEDALDDVLTDDGAQEDGEIDGVTVYKDDSGDPYAVDGDTLIVADSREQLERAISTRDGDESLTEDDFDAGTDGLPGDALVRVYLNVESMLGASPSTADALRSKWVAALRTGGIALSVEDGERVAIAFNLNTDPDGLDDEDLPLAAGGEAPEVLDRDGDVNVALRDLSQVVAFAQATAQAVDPEGYAEFEEGRAEAERQLKVDIQEEIVDQLQGDIAVSVGTDGKFGGRAEVGDPDALRATLRKLEPVLPDIAGGAAGERVGFTTPRGGDDLYAVATAGGDQIFFGVVNDFLVVSNDARIADTLAEQGTRAIDGAAGALVAETDAEQLAQTLLRQASGSGFDLGDEIVGRVGTQPLADLVGSVELTTEGLSGSFTLNTDD